MQTSLPSASVSAASSSSSSSSQSQQSGQGQQQGQGQVHVQIQAQSTQGGKESILTETKPEPENNFQKIVDDLIDVETRDKSLTILNKNRDRIPNLAQMLWYTPGVMSVLLHEIVSVYPILFTPHLVAHRASVSAAMQLMQVVATSDDVCPFLLDSNMYLYLFPFLKIADRTQLYECLRLSGLGVIGALSRHPKAVVPLMKTEIVSICTNVMRNSPNLSKQIALFIVQKLLRDPNGRVQICGDSGMLGEVLSALNEVMVMAYNSLGDPARDSSGSSHQDQSIQLLGRIFDCFVSIADDQDGLIGLKKVAHPALRNGLIAQVFPDEKYRRKLADVCKKINGDALIQQQQQQQQLLLQQQQQQQQQQPVYMPMSTNLYQPQRQM